HTHTHTHTRTHTHAHAHTHTRSHIASPPTLSNGESEEGLLTSAKAHTHTQLGSSELVEKMSTTSTLFIFYEALYDHQLMRSFTVKTGRCYDRQRSAKGDCCSFALSSRQTTTVIISAMVIQLHSHISMPHHFIFLFLDF